MNLPGHLAAAYLWAWGRRGAPPQPWDALVPMWIGALVPDVIDKTAQALTLTLYGRTAGHSLCLWLPLALLWLAARRPRRFGWLVFGGLSHLAVDLADDVVEGLERTGWVFSAWFAWPITNPDMWNVASPHLLGRMPHAVTMLELATVTAWVWHVVARHGKAIRRAR